MKEATNTVKPKFSIGEEIIEDWSDRKGVVKSIVIRDERYQQRVKYLVEFTEKALWKTYTRTEWLFENELNKIIN